MTTVDRDVVVDRESREPGTIPSPTRAVRSSPVTRASDRSGVGWSVAVAALAAVLPLITDPAGWFVFVAARWTVLSGATAVLLAGLALVGRVRRVPGTGWWATLVGIALVSAFGSGATRIALFGTNDRRAGAAMWVVHGALFVVGAAVVRRPGDLRRVVRGVSVGAIVVTVLVAAQRMGWSLPWGTGPRVRPGGPLGNADFLGAFAALALLVAIGAALDRAESERWRLVHLVAALGSAFGLVLSGTRGAWIGVVAGLVAFAVLAARGPGVSLRAAWAGVGVVAIGLVGLGMWAGVGDRLDTLTSGTAAGRLATWERTASVIGARPVLGWGPEGTAVGFGRAVDDSWEREYGRRLVPDRAHNGLLDVGATLGLVGLAAYVGLLAATGRAVRRGLDRVGTGTDGLGGTAAVGVAAALVAYVVQQQFLFQLFDVDGLAWLLAGGVVGLGVARPLGDGPSSADRARRVAVVAGAGVLALVVLLSVQGMRADRAARSATDAPAGGSAAAVVDAARAVGLDPQVMHALVLTDAALADGGDRVLADARTRLADVAAVTPDDGRLTLARSRLARARGVVADVEASRGEVLGLLSDEPSRSDAWAELGDVELQLDENASAQRSFERAISLAPGQDGWRVRLAIAADRAGDRMASRAAIATVDPSSLDADGLALRERLLAGTTRPSPGQ